MNPIKILINKVEYDIDDITDVLASFILFSFYKTDYEPIIYKLRLPDRTDKQILKQLIISNIIVPEFNY